MKFNHRKPPPGAHPPPPEPQAQIAQEADRPCERCVDGEVLRAMGSEPCPDCNGTVKEADRDA